MRTIKAAKDCGVDAIKLQTYKPNTITIDSNKKYFKISQKSVWDGDTYFSLYKKAHTPWEWHKKLFDYSKNLGLICFSSPFDNTAVDLLEELNCPAYKIASAEINDINLIEYIAKLKKPMILSTGLADIEDINLAVRTINKYHNKIIILKCNSEYPTPSKNLNIKNIKFLQRKFKLNVGFSDHSLSDNAAIASVAYGARFIEKHILLNKKLKTPDSSFSLTPKEFSNLVINIRETEKIVGDNEYKISSRQKILRKINMRSLFIVKDVKKNEKINKFNVRSIRPGNGMHPKNLNIILGKVFKKNFQKGTPLKREYYK
jgi:pseudaminic acid synthase